MGIVERLRKRKAYNAEYDFHGNEIIGDDPDEDCQEAADEIERLREALSDLVGLQNGPPLVTYTDAWNAAMDKAYAALKGDE